MYSVYVGDKVLYSPVLAREGFVIFGNGCYVDEMNKPGSFSFSVPATNPYYGEIKPMQTIITVKNNNEIVWRGRTVSVDKDFYNTKSVVCEGEMAYLYDVLFSRYIASATVSEYFKNVMEFYNSKCHVSRQFDLTEYSFDTNCEFADEVLKLEDNPYDWPTVFDALTENITDTFGGFFKILYKPNSRELVYLSMPSHNGNKKIQFGKNLLDLEENLDFSNIFTRLYIFGAEDGTGKRLDVSEPESKSVHLDADEEAINRFGIIEKILTFDEIESPSVLRSLGRNLLKEATVLPSRFTVKAVDLSVTDKTFQKYEVGDAVLVESPAHGLKEYFTCTRVEINIFDPTKSEYLFGITSDSLTDRMVGTSKKLRSVENNISNLKNGIVIQ